MAALLCGYWAHEGHAVTLVLTYRGREPSAFELHDDIDLIYLSDLVGDVPKWLPMYLRRLSALRSIMTSRSPDVVYSFLTNVNVMVLIAGLGLHIPVVISERSYPPMVPISRALRVLRVLTYPWAHKVVMQTQDGLDWLTRAIPRAKGASIANPVSIPIPIGTPVCLPETHVPKGVKLVLAVGRLAPEKQFDKLIDAFAMICKGAPQAHLVIAGEGPLRATLTEQVRVLDLEGRVSLVGKVGNIQDWYEAASLFVLSSAFEGFPNALMEAVCSGVPAVSFDCATGPRDIVGSWAPEALVPPSEGAEGLARAMGVALHARLPQPDTQALQAQHAVKRIADQWTAQWDIAS